MSKMHVKNVYHDASYNKKTKQTSILKIINFKKGV